MNAVRVCIDQYDADLQGRIYSRLSREPLFFGSCSKMLLETDRLFDEHGYPQNFQEKRSFALTEEKKYSSFAAPQPLLESEDILRQSGACGTFDVIVWSRRRAGWQGMLRHPDGMAAGDFRSEMELLDMICRELEEAHHTVQVSPAAAEG